MKGNAITLRRCVKCGQPIWGTNFLWQMVRQPSGHQPTGRGQHFECPRPSDIPASTAMEADSK